MKKTIFIVVLLSLAMLGLNGCTSPNAIQANMNVQAAKYLNPDVNGRASPIEVSFYQLKTPFAFNQANFYKLQDNAAAVLQDNLVDKNTIEIRPNQQRVYKLSLPMSVHFVGITAGFRSMDHAKWRALIRVPKPKSKWYHWWNANEITVSVDLHTQEIKARLIT